MIKIVKKCQIVWFDSLYPNPWVMALVPQTSPSWTWIRLIKACSSLFITFLKSTLTHVSQRSQLKASLNLLTLSLVTRSIGTSNGSFGGSWITSFPLSSKGFDLESLPTSKKERSTILIVTLTPYLLGRSIL